MKTIKFLIATFIILIAGISSLAQDSTNSRHSAFQMTFVHPLSTNGLQNKEFVNDVSLNLMAGYSGGVSGVEFSGLAGHLQYDMDGIQLAGFSNSALGTGNGIQFSGFSNYIGQSFNGVQLTGFSNVVSRETTGFQFAGFSNVSAGLMKGFQMAGLNNYSQGNLAGQVTGFSNINIGDLKGLQIAGFANVSTGKVNGIQISGFFNYTKKLNGLQLGVFNYVDSLEQGAVIGVFNYIKDGYRTFEISTSESLYGVATYKSGTEQFYTMLSAGISPKDNMLLWGWGFGVGTIISFSPRSKMAIEGISYHINEDEWFTDRLNLLNKLQVSTSWKATEKVSMFAGASWNVVVADNRDKEGHPVESSIAPWTTWEKTSGSTDVSMYPGVSAGFRF